MQVDAVIVAAGLSSRFGAEDKLASDLCGRPLLAWVVGACGAASSIGGMVIVTSSPQSAWMTELGIRWGAGKRVAVVAGGTRRRDSVEAGLGSTRSRHVAILDGARPLTTPELIDRVVTAAEGGNGAIAAVPVTDTIKEVEGGLVYGHPERSRLWAAQTPQVVLRQAWLDAAHMGDGDETDDAAMLARLGLECAVVESTPENLKVTRPLDLEVAALILRARGQGA